MKHKIIIFVLLIVTLSSNINAQQTTKRTTKPKQPKKETILEVPLPARCADCFFPVKLTIDVPFGPTEPLRGFGYVNEIKRDAKTKNIFEEEHNSIWYELEIPYPGKLCIDITPKASSDDYDFLVYKYTDKYFCNRIPGNKLTPIRSVLSSNNSKENGKTGLSHKGTLTNIDKNSDAAYGKYIDALEGEKFVIVLDNLTDGGLGHTINAYIHTDFAPLSILPIDSINRERTTANFLITDKESNRIILEKQDAGAQKIKILPDRTCAISLKKEGYFNYFREVSHAQAIKDSILTARLVEIKVGSSLPIDDVYYDVDEDGKISILPESYPSLERVVSILKEYPRIQVEVKGKIATEGLNIKKDVETSRHRAETIKAYLVSQGIPEMNIRARGSSIKDLEKQLSDQKRIKGLINPRPEIKILKTK